MIAEKKLAEKDAAAALGVSVKTLQHWRLVGRGPSYLKYQGAIRYPESALENYLREHLREARNA